MINIPFDVIGISETEEQIDNEFISNVELRGYSMYSQPSKSLCGGRAIYVNSQLDHQVRRNDLSVLEEESMRLFRLKSITKKTKTFFVAVCIGIHLVILLTKFIDHMTSILQKVQRENKTLFIMGDLNINLYNYSSHTETNDFINLMVSNYLLPHILHPTRVTDHSATIIDNIFSNNCELDTLSGNLLSKISDHFLQFLIIKMCYG